VLELLTGSPPVFITCCVVLGLLVGSFLNVVIHRLPLMLERQWRNECALLAGNPPADQPRYDLFMPRSACPACQRPITALENIPIASYLWLRGRCAGCATAISARYPLIEGLTALASGLVAWRFGYGSAAAMGLVLTWFLIALATIDLDTQLLPDSLTLPLLWLGLACAVILPNAGQALPVDLQSSVIGAMAGYVSLWSVFHLFRLATGKEGMGYGDFKLLAALGAWLGWQMLLPIVLAAAGVGAVVGVALIALRGHQRSTPIPFGPFLAAAGWLMLLFGHELVDRYLALYAPH
jgi:leader peptidase (prepilin peptidase)/N-methyltransferase